MRRPHTSQARATEGLSPGAHTSEVRLSESRRPTLHQQGPGPHARPWVRSSHGQSQVPEELLGYELKGGRQGHPSSTGTEAPALATWLPLSLHSGKAGFCALWVQRGACNTGAHTRRQSWGTEAHPGDGPRVTKADQHPEPFLVMRSGVKQSFAGRVQKEQALSRR